jgi:hypothetical protein
MCGERSRASGEEDIRFEAELARRIASRLAEPPEGRLRTIQLSVLDFPPKTYTRKRKNMYLAVFKRGQEAEAHAWALTELLAGRIVCRRWPCGIGTGSSIEHERLRGAC